MKGPRYSNNLSRVGVLTKLVKSSGALVAGTLGDLQPEKPEVRFNCKSVTSHAHTWICGAENKVCTQCGLTVPKSQEVPDFVPVTGL